MKFKKDPDDGYCRELRFEDKDGGPKSTVVASVPKRRHRKTMRSVLFIAEGKKLSMIGMENSELLQFAKAIVKELGE